MKYINVKGYSDVESYQVTNIDEKAGTATAISVVKHIKPHMIPGGFAAHCPNLIEEFAAAKPEIADGAIPFQITRNKNGIWGFKRDVHALFLPVKALVKEWVEETLKKGEAEIKGDMLIVYELTKNGKRKTTFEKLGTLENECRYFYDYNF